MADDKSVPVTSVNDLMQAVRAIRCDDDWLNAIAEIHVNLNVGPLAALLATGKPPPPDACMALADLLDSKSEHSATNVVLMPERRKGQTKEKDEAFQRKLAAVIACERLHREGMPVEKAVEESATEFGCEPRQFYRIRKEVLSWLKWLSGRH
jgi:hypothetical protein